ncbi:MAG TPA: hypothetical protein VH113_04645 [Gemmatimonadales bacterium]|nr:hypothetical protein [Gemmatimonadales bacterium]
MPRWITAIIFTVGLMDHAGPGPKVTLSFARDTTRLHYAVREQFAPGATTAREVSLVWAVWETIVYVTEEASDSGPTRLLRVRVDSNQGGSGGDMGTGPYPGFKALFNDRRQWIDTTTIPDSIVNVFRGIALNGMIPLPDQPVGVGDSWTSDGPMQITHFLGSIRNQRTSTGCKVKAIRVVGGDTLVDFDIKVRLHGDYTSPRGQGPVDLDGTLDGRETFSVSRGVTESLKLAGRLEWEQTHNTPRGPMQVPVAIDQTIQRTLIP